MVFICVFYGINYAQPAWIYLPSGALREFGIGYKKKTIFPIWLFSIVLGVVAYLLVNYFVVRKKIARINW